MARACRAEAVTRFLARERVLLDAGRVQCYDPFVKLTGWSRLLVSLCGSGEVEESPHSAEHGAG